MKRFEYEITKHSSDTFDKVVYFCSEAGQCSLNDVTKDETRVLSAIPGSGPDRGALPRRPARTRILSGPPITGSATRRPPSRESGREVGNWDRDQRTQKQSQPDPD